MHDINRSIEACAAHYGKHSNAMRDYLTEGHERALMLDNRGPIRFNKDGSLDDNIRHAYSKYGFYVFTNVFGPEELADLDADLKILRGRFPKTKGSALDHQGRAALGTGCIAPNLQWAKPLGDPLGGTQFANGRHQVKLFEPKPANDAPDEAPFILMGSLQFSIACLRAYAHPELLKVAAEINGSDFAPFHESLFIKDPGLGAAVSWHQDGDTHWDSPDFDENIHGFNFMGQVYGSTAVNGVWVIPGTHKTGRADIRKMVEDAGSERLPHAVPMICNPGDSVISNRQIVHGSFANTGFETRVTVNFGFHRRSSVLDVQGAGIHSEARIYDDAFINQRSRVIGLAIDARRQRFPDEKAFVYEPFESLKEPILWNDESHHSLRDYNLMDLSI